MEENQIDSSLHRQLVQQQLNNWRVRMDDWSIAAKVAIATGDEADKERAKAEITKCIKAIESLVKMLMDATPIQPRDDDTPPED